MKFNLSIAEIVLRLFLAVICAGLIGFNRQQKNQFAGIRTHVLVCVGACIIALLQKKLVMRLSHFLFKIRSMRR
ncbi:MgtC/SapB family protein [Xylocopilactobacillus apicola]|uniref:MgtC/SapB family protein n=1 Tax=Xylocopilactobacillus apicola TaxID=2932184 RepID=UPI0029548E75|nr:MgtC/SapB family protein [Xylocopilactobacillus apicola]